MDYQSDLDFYSMMQAMQQSAQPNGGVSQPGTAQDYDAMRAELRDLQAQFDKVGMDEKREIAKRMGQLNKALSGVSALDPMMVSSRQDQLMELYGPMIQALQQEIRASGQARGQAAAGQFRRAALSGMGEAMAQAAQAGAEYGATVQGRQLEYGVAQQAIGIQEGERNREHAMQMLNAQIKAQRDAMRGNFWSNLLQTGGTVLAAYGTGGASAAMGAGASSLKVPGAPGPGPYTMQPPAGSYGPQPPGYAYPGSYTPGQF